MDYSQFNGNICFDHSLLYLKDMFPERQIADISIYNWTFDNEITQHQ